MSQHAVPASANEDANSAVYKRIMALFMSAIPVSGLLGSPLSGWIPHHFSCTY